MALHVGGDFSTRLPFLYLSPKPFLLQVLSLIMSLQVDSSSIVQQIDKADLEDQKCDATNSANEKNLGLTTVDKEEGARFQEGGIRGWAAVIGA